MNPQATLYALLGLALTLGAALIYLGLQPRTEHDTDHDPGRDPLARLKAAGVRLSRRELITLAVATLAGLVIAILTGWVVALMALPIAAIMLPRITSSTNNKSETDLLEAMEEWTRALSGVLHASTGLTEALVLTRRSAPEAIRPQVDLLVTRLQARQPAQQALRAFADDLNHPTGDLIASALLVGARQSGAGLTQILSGLATAVAAEVRVRRQIEAERAGPRTTARILILISVPGLAAFLLLTPYGQAYGDPFGQAVLSVILLLFFADLFWLHWITVPKPETRFLTTEATR